MSERNKSVFLVEVQTTHRVEAKTAEGAIRILKKQLDREAKVASVRLEHPAFTITREFECSRCAYRKELPPIPAGQAVEGGVR